MIDDSVQVEASKSNTYKNNLITIRPWLNENQRDHVLKDCLAIIK
jgi:hypothetical protein